MSDFTRRRYPAALIALAIAASLTVLSRLSDPMAVHWDLAGNPNGWLPRNVGAFFSPAMMLALWGIFRAAPRLDPRGANYEKFGGAYDLTIAATLTLLFAVHLVVLAMGMGYHVNIALLGPLLMGGLFVVMGNVLPLARSNFLYGIRTPWTLSNERVWARTHRFGGYVMTTAGLVMIASAIILPADVCFAIVIASVVASVLAPMVYSYLTWKREMKQ